MNQQENDFHIRALEYAESKDQFTLSELECALSLSKERKKQLALQIHHNQLFSHNSSNYFSNQDNEVLHLSIEDKFRILNYRALQEARESSRDATNQATKAFWLSIATLVISSIFSYIQLCSSPSMPEELGKKINKLNQSAESIASNTSSLHKIMSEQINSKNLQPFSPNKQKERND